MTDAKSETKPEKKVLFLDEKHTLTVENEIDEENFKIVRSYINLKTIEVEQKIKNEESEKKCYLESDSYILMSIIIDKFFQLILLFLTISILVCVFASIFLIFPILFCFGKLTKDSIKRFLGKCCYLFFALLQLSIMLFLLTILASPAILVLLTQLFCVSSIFSNIQMTDSSEIEDLEIKWLLNLFFLFLVGNEIVQSVKTLVFFSIKIIVVGWSSCRSFTLIFALMPPIAQMTITFVIYYLSVSMIYVDQDMISFIQNFAGFYIILEFDNMAIKFLQIIDFYGFLKWTIKGLNSPFPQSPEQKKKGFLYNFDKINQKEIFKNLVEDEEFQDVLTEEKVKFREEQEQKTHQNHENFILFLKSFVLAMGLTLVYMDFNDII